MARHQSTAAVARRDPTPSAAPIDTTLAPALKRAFPLPEVGDDLFQRLLDALAQKERAGRV